MSDQKELVAGRYRLIQRVGSGGMGHVWRAWDERLDRTVALKQLRTPVDLADDEARVARQRVMREARITAKLEHPNAVTVFDVVDHDGAPCLVMQYAPSRSLQEVLTEEGPLPPREVARLGAGIAAALDAAHRAGIVHRDVKPGNILVTTAGTPLLTDFGISRAEGDAALTSTGMLSGTPAYLAPEVARGEQPTPAADVFSLGSTLYAAVEGRSPFGVATNPMALLHAVASGRVSPPEQAGPLGRVLEWMLSAQPQDRPTMAAVARALEAVAAGNGDTLTLPAAREADRSTLVVPAEVAGAAGGGAAGGAAAAGAAAASSDAGPPTRPHPAAQPEPAARPAPRPAAASPQAPASGAAPASVAPTRPADGDDGSRRRRRGIAAVAAALVAGLVLLTVYLGSRDDTPEVAAPAPSTSSSASPTPSPSTPSPSASPTPTPSTTTAAPTSTAPRPTSSAPKPTTTSPTPTPTSPEPTSGPPTGAELTGAIRTYYGLLPGNTDAGWDLLTRRYQSTDASSRGTYERFWGSIDSVRVNAASAPAPSTVVATLTYDYADGRTFVERRSYTLKREDGRLKIDRSSVLSSRQV